MFSLTDFKALSFLKYKSLVLNQKLSEISILVYSNFQAVTGKFGTKRRSRIKWHKITLEKMM
jgi:hypothetical protein